MSDTRYVPSFHIHHILYSSGLIITSANWAVYGSGPGSLPVRGPAWYHSQWCWKNLVRLLSDIPDKSGISDKAANYIFFSKSSPSLTIWN